MSKGNRNRRRPTGSRGQGGGGGQRRTAAQVRAEKRAQFTDTRKRSQLPIILGAVAVAVAVVVGVFVMTSRGGASSYAQAQPVGNTVTMPMSQVADGNAHFFSYTAGNTKVNYFVMASPDGTVRAAFDACEVCYAKKKGYHQTGTSVQCNNCGRVFPSDKINVITGGCNPIPLKRTVKGGNLVLSTSDIEAGANYFL